MTTRITLGEAGEFFESMGDKWAVAARRGLLSAAMRGVQIIKTQIIPARSPQPVDRGVYRSGWDARVTPDGADIFNPELHAAFIEHGVRAENVKAGKRMIAALAEWTVRKGIAHSYEEGTQIAYAIAGAMKKRGIFNRFGRGGLGILRELVEQHMPKIVREEVSRELRKVR